MKTDRNEPELGFDVLHLDMKERGRMEKRRLGRSNLSVSAMGLGCWAIGGPWTYQGAPAGWGQVDDSESIRAIHHALDAGIDFFDTAANYGCGHSEQILGQALGARRAGVTLATKFGYVVDEETKSVTDSPDLVGSIREDCERSLQRLGTDYIDLYQLHVDDYDPQAIDEVCAVLEDLVAEGKIRWYGWSTNNPQGARAIAKGRHCTAIQHTLSMRIYRPEILAVCEENSLASINRYPLASGLLTGKFRTDTTFPEDDFRHGDYFRQPLVEGAQQMQALREAFAGSPRTPAQIALGWIWAISDATIPIPGFKNLAQVAENVGALDLGPLTADEVNKVEVVFGRASRAPTSPP
jgi:aryl-alcohol dehydrogenase-like predicted oxidoreductase